MHHHPYRADKTCAHLRSGAGLAFCKERGQWHDEPTTDSRAEIVQIPPSSVTAIHRNSTSPGSRHPTIFVVDCLLPGHG